MIETIEQPRIPLIPATVSISTQAPDVGWWNWDITFIEAIYQDATVVPWNRTDISPRKTALSIRCSAAFDPVPDLHIFLRCAYGIDDAEWRVDEEGCSVTIQTWYLNYRTVQLRIFSDDYAADYCHDFVLDRDEFLRQFADAYHSFGKYGGWGDYGDNATEDDFPGPAIEVATTMENEPLPALHISDLQDEAKARMFSILLQELRTSRGQQIPTDKALRICVSRLDKPLAKALGGKVTLTELAGQVIDAWIANGLLTQVETATKIMLKLGRTN